MADYTPNYGLHQWEASDSFLRTDFNQDFSKIDAALGRAERSAQANAYNLYNLMLQNYYESKYTGYKKALIFDGFLDSTGIEAADKAVVCGGGALRLRQTPVAAPSTGYGTELCSMSGYSESQAVTAETRFQVTGFTFQAMYSSGTLSANITATLNVNGTAAGSGSVTATLDATHRLITVSFPPVWVESGDRLTVRIAPVAGMAYYVSAADGTSMGGSFSITMPCAKTALVTTAPAETGSYERALGWVRYAGGSVALTLNGQVMEGLETRESMNLQNEPCRETFFSLEWTRGPGAVVTLALDCGTDTSMAVFDYGVALL